MNCTVGKEVNDFLIVRESSRETIELAFESSITWAVSMLQS